MLKELKAEIELILFFPLVLVKTKFTKQKGNTILEYGNKTKAYLNTFSCLLFYIHP